MSDAVEMKKIDLAELTVASPETDSKFTKDAMALGGQLKVLFEGVALTWVTLPSVVSRAMELAEKYELLSGAEKRALVVETVQHLIAILGDATELKQDSRIIESLVPTLIDQVIVATKNGLMINHSLRSCFPCFK
jgi:hypothetical protein